MPSFNNVQFCGMKLKILFMLF